MSQTVTVKTLMEMKQKKTPIVSLTAYDYPFARIADENGIDVLLVGDSLGNVVQGGSSTLGVTMDEMLYHTRIVARGAKRALVVGDMPFLSYQVSLSEAVYNAGRFLKETGAAAVKLEGGAAVIDRIKAMTDAGIPVQAHIGLTPQSVHQMGGYRVQKDEERLIMDAEAVESAGAFSVVLEGIPKDIAGKITGALKIPTIGIGAGRDCDGQILVLHDMLGLTQGHVPKFVKQFAFLKNSAAEGIAQYIKEVREHSFPTDKHSY